MKKNTSDYQKLFAKFGITKVMEKVAYCNNNVIPLLEERGIVWDMTPMRIIFCGKTFPMKHIENGDAEEFINNLIDEEGQATLTLYKRR